MAGVCKIGGAGRGVAADFAVAAEFLQRAADSNNHNGANSWDACLDLGEGIEAQTEGITTLPNKQESVSALEQSTSRGDH
jgi:TPR repeat protein